MKGEIMINVKKQTKRTTKWYERFANNINVFYDRFEFGILTTESWGNFDIADEAKVEITVDEIDYNYSISNFKSLVVNDKIYKDK